MDLPYAFDPDDDDGAPMRRPMRRPAMRGKALPHPAHAAMHGYIEGTGEYISAQ